MAGSGERSDTVRNARANPAVTVRVGDDARPAVATVVTDPGEAARVRAAMVAKYESSPGELASWAERALPVRLEIAETGT